MSTSIGSARTPSPTAYANLQRNSQISGAGDDAPSASPFGEDSVTLSSAARGQSDGSFQVAEMHLNTPLAIRAAQMNPGTSQQYQYGYNGNGGSVSWVNGELKWGK